MAMIGSHKEYVSATPDPGQSPIDNFLRHDSPRENLQRDPSSNSARDLSVDIEEISSSDEADGVSASESEQADESQSQKDNFTTNYVDPILFNEPFCINWDCAYHKTITKILEDFDIICGSIDILRLGYEVPVNKNPICICITTEQPLSISIQEEIECQVYEILVEKMKTFFGDSDELKGLLKIKFFLGKVARCTLVPESDQSSSIIIDSVAQSPELDDHVLEHPKNFHVGQTIDAGDIGTMGIIFSFKTLSDREVQAFIMNPSGHTSREDGRTTFWGLTAHHVATDGRSAITPDAGEVVVKLYPDTQADDKPSSRQECGTIILSSGLESRTDYGGRLDWALIKLRNSPEKYNQIVSEEGKSIDGICEDWPRFRKYSSTRGPDKSSKVFMFGGIRGSKHMSRAYVNGIQSVVYPDSTQGPPSYEWAITDPNPEEEIFWNGDSGNMLFRKVKGKYQAVGLVIGRGRLHGTNFGYMTPLKHVFKHMREKFGENSPVMSMAMKSVTKQENGSDLGS